MKFLVFAVGMFASLYSFAQKGEKEKTSYYVYDADWSPCKIEQAVYLGVFKKLSDTAFQWKYYNFSGPIISIQTFKDEESTIPHGYLSYFDTKGIIDSSGYTFNGKKDKQWFYYTDTLSVWQVDEYDKGKLIKRRDSLMLKAERIAQNTIKFLPSDKEADFKGGTRNWISYLQKNLEFPERAQKLQIGGKVQIVFTVGSDGLLSDLHLVQSKEYSLDEEAMRLIKKSPKWEPAIQYNKKIKAYRRQPITFAYASE